VVVASGAPVAVQPANPTVIRPPFTGATKTVLPGKFAPTVGCGYFATLDPHSFYLTSGKLRYDAVAVAPNCTGSRSAAAVVYYQIALPLNVTKAQLSVLLNWTVVANGSATLVLGKCQFPNRSPERSCNEQAQAWIAIHPWLADTTNGTNYYPSNGSGWADSQSFYHEGPCYRSRGCSSGPGGSGAFRINRTVLVWMNATGLNMTHHYLLEVQVAVGVVAGLTCQKCVEVGGHARAALDLETGMNGARFNSITLY